MLAYLEEMKDPEELRALTAWKVHMLTGDRKALGASALLATAGLLSASTAKITRYTIWI
jgi:hypothetical protein